MSKLWMMRFNGNENFDICGMRVKNPLARQSIFSLARRSRQRQMMISGRRCSCKRVLQSGFITLIRSSCTKSWIKQIWDKDG